MANLAHASDVETTAIDDSIGREYFTIEENETNLKSDFSPLSAGIELARKLETLASTKLNLLKWIRHEARQKETPERYIRKTHFGQWIKDPTRATCLNIRGKVLVRDAASEVRYRDDKSCVVESATWNDPYSGETHFSAEDMQIDHFVPLKNAYLSGAWKWSTSRRCHYANYIGNDFHLLAVTGRENQRKSDRAPDEYLPGNEEFVCDYLENWLKVKAIWQLKLSQSEANAILHAINTYNCSSKTFTISRSTLSRQRNETREIPETCIRREERLSQANLNLPRM